MTMVTREVRCLGEGHAVAPTLTTHCPEFPVSAPEAGGGEIEGWMSAQRAVWGRSQDPSQNVSRDTAIRGIPRLGSPSSWGGGTGSEVASGGGGR